MAISYEIDKEHCTVELLFDSPISLEDYQTVMPGLVKDVTAEMVDKWLIKADGQDQTDSAHVMSFTSFIFNDLKSYIKKVAIICPPNAQARIREIMEPIENQEKPVKFYQSIDEAREWLRK